MYYPFLRAKQYELKALREFAEANIGQRCIAPIIEPVKMDTKNLDVAMTDLINSECKFALVLNPQNGDFKHPTVSFDSWTNNETLMQRMEEWIPAFIYSKGESSNILRFIDSHNLGNVMMIFLSCLDAEDESAWSLINSGHVHYVVNDFGSASRRLKSMLIATGREIISLNSCFKTKNRNADYAQNVDEFFTDEPFFYIQDQLSGYSDYTTLPSEYIEGGMLPYSLAIHFTYKRPDDTIYVHHFVSDTNFTADNVRGKFKEAADKVVEFYQGRDSLTSAVRDLIEKASSPNGYPGLGYLKKLSILNHLEVIKSL
jgi:hypothetical protein